MTTFSKTATLAGEDVLLRFTNIGKDIFPQTLKATQDLATGLGIDLTSAAAIVGRALDAPANASRSLRSAQIVLNTEQQKLIKGFVDAGEGAKAQAFILDILQTKFGGLSTAIGQTFGGQVKILQNNLELVQEQMGSVLANAFGPFIDMITRFVSNNQQLVASLGIAALASLGFAAAVIAVVGAVTLALAVLGPFAIVLLALSALIGVTVFKAVQNFQTKMAETTKGFVDGSKAIAQNGANDFGAAGQAASDLAQKLADIKLQMDQTTADFQQSLATIVRTHQQSVETIKSQIADETKAFDEAQTKMTQSHEQKTRTLEDQIKALQITNSQADQQKINDLRVTLAQENEAYQRDAQNATDAHTTKLTDFQKKLQAETDFLNKHNDDIAAIQNVQILDEIDKLKQSHERQMAAFDRQTSDAIKAANKTTAGMAGAFNDLPNQIQGHLLDGVGSQLGKDMAEALKQSFVDSVKNLPKTLAGWAGDVGTWLEKVSHGGLTQSALSHVPIPQFAEGGIVPGALNEPQLAIVHGGERVIPNGGAAGTININLNAQAFMGSQVEARKFAQIIGDHLSDISSMKGAGA